MVFYFAGEARNIYQAQQWVWSLEQLRDRLRMELHEEAPVVILVRSASNASLLHGLTDLPIYLRKSVGDLEGFFLGSPSLRVVLYPNQATQNFQSLRFARPAHVHLSHGESEKISMISNQLKAYDYVFTAGPAARSRLRKTLINFGEERMIDVGRPQLDAPYSVPEAWTKMRTGRRNPVVFFAPTWEGESSAMAYSGVPEYGIPLAKRLLNQGLDVLYRPHPRAGSISSVFAKADRDIEELLSAAPGSMVDKGPHADWQFHAADVCVAEVSSIAYDWLPTTKPLFMVKPSNPRAEILPGGLLEQVPSFRADQVTALIGAIADAATARPGSENVSQWTEVSQWYFGDTTAGAQQRRFEDAVLTVIGQRNADLGYS
ncbi:CDP-glycerol glycerophosphotransferase family protein [Brevibacterium sp. 50QC2O2]|uniref:CDP-glycerol glycerophosphotransferase family protein n=1 Tax=Brevibacterium TaxID=1696 RepID=UPI00211BB188|nr:CDP-glycerol glycerophosphotransferase family protein [Brevibacterium sp. 91QC2O2]MCQ9384486.1 CDP-glycerol glycerophosphotransferase family protein [Brevibacterium sp. 68QC2CO]MCQ9387823.1 CDP-glycerol glycerophosphotransferase family protein [Brevibacterium sp. 50QC2O2]